MRQPLRSRDILQSRRAIGGWLKVAIVWQLAVVIGSGLYVALQESRHATGGFWIAPPVGAVFGTAIPLQVVVMSLMRSARG